MSNGADCGAVHDGSIIVIDSEERNIRCIKDGAINVIAGTGRAGRAGLVYGSGVKAQFAQPTSIAAQGNTIIITDTGNAAVTMITGTKGLAKYLMHIGKLFDTFSVHSTQTMPLDTASDTLKEVLNYFIASREVVKEKLGVNLSKVLRVLLTSIWFCSLYFE